MLEVIKKKSTTLTIVSAEVDNVYNNSLVVDADALYIGSYFPFNSFFIKHVVANETASNLQVAAWDGSTWADCARVTDETSLSGATFGQDGYITIVPNRDNVWTKEDTEDIDELSTLTIYDQYWLKLTFSSVIDVLTEVQWMGTKFSNDTDLGVEFPELTLSALIAGFQTGKTTWEEQHILAANIIENDLKAKSIISDKLQLIERRNMVNASISKVAEIIFNGLGQDNQEDVNAARAEYNRRINKSFTVDQNSDGVVDPDERASNLSVGELTRR